MTGDRQRARESALRILYFWEVGATEPAPAIDAYFTEHDPTASEEVRGFASRLVIGTIDELPTIDALIEKHSTHWRLDRMAVLDRLVLRQAIWELRHERDTPPAAVINEALELTRKFSGEEAVKFVNGVLDAVHRAMQAGPTESLS